VENAKSSSRTLVIPGRGDPVDEENLVEFGLIYQGLLPSTGNKSRPEQAQEIRLSLHPQLKRLWLVKPGLQELAAAKGVSAAAKDKVFYDSLNLSWPEAGLVAIGKKWNKGGIDFIPLVTSDVVLRCALDILLLRAGEKRYISHRGDLDGQLATLFDALAVPQNTEQIFPKTVRPDEMPMYCLLQNDNLISDDFDTLIWPRSIL
jgi:hypothetical protein